MKHAAAVSIVIPVYNQEKYIGRCMRSALNQRSPAGGFEILVVNDGSSDRTEYALELFKDDIKILCHPQRRGLPATLNTGIRAAKGRFIVRLDADDYAHTEYINVLSMFLLMNPAYDAVACDYQLVDDDERVLETVDCMERPIGCGIMFRIEHLVELDLYDEEMQMHEDKDLRIRFLEQYEIHRVALPLYRYRRHGGNMTNKDQAAADYLEVLNRKHDK